MSSNHNKLISICYGQYAFITINELKIELLSVGVMIRENITSHKLFITFQRNPLRAFIYSKILTFARNYKILLIVTDLQYTETHHHTNRSN